MKMQGRSRPVQHQCTVLVFAQPCSEIEDLVDPLHRRADLCLLRVATLAAAEVAFRDVEVSLAIVCPETSAGVVTALLDAVADLRPGMPVLAIRAHSGEPLPSWKARAVGVLRSPVVPDVLSRTVDVALGLRRKVAASRSRSR
jgi:hypothetical protein